MDPYKETFETWNKVAKLYQDKFMNLELYNDTYDIFCNKLKNEKPYILEIGCGPGNITKYILTKRPDFKIDAIDVSINMIELAHINNPSAKFIQMDCREIDKLKSSYDGIFCGFCLPYLSEYDCKKLIKDFNSLTTNNGLIYLSFVEGDSNSSGYQVGSSGDRIYFHYHNLEHLKCLLNENNFSITDVVYKTYSKNNQSDEVHTIILAQKISV